MKKAILYTFLLFILNNLNAQVEETFYNNGNLKSKISYNSYDEYNGIYETYYDNNQLEKKGKYNKSGNQIGLWNEYYKDGSKHEITEFDNKGNHKKTQIFHRDGEIIGLAIDDKNIGTWKYYTGFSGYLYLIENYNDNGELHGTTKNYSKEGVLTKESNYVNGFEDGESKSYHENGNIKELMNYKNGKLFGKQAVYYENGQILFEAIIDERGIPTSSKSYTKEGKLRN